MTGLCHSRTLYLKELAYGALSKNEPFLTFEELNVVGDEERKFWRISESGNLQNGLLDVAALLDQLGKFLHRTPAPNQEQFSDQPVEESEKGPRKALDIKSYPIL